MGFGAGFASEEGTSFDGDVSRRAAAVSLVDLIGESRLLRPNDAIAFAQRAQREFAAVEAAALVALKAAGASQRDIQRKSTAGGTRSRKETAKTEKRADAVGANPKLGSKLARGDIGSEQLDALADASAKSGGDAATDDKLIEEIEKAKPDDANKITRKWMERREDDGAQSRFDRQNARRNARNGFDRINKVDTFELGGPSERITEIKKKVEQRANEMYLADGGRDVPDLEHPRTHQQRMFDAAYELIMGSGNSKEDSKAPSAVHPRAMVHVGITVDPDDEKLIRAECPDGSGYLPDSVLEKYGCASIIAGSVFNAKGEPIWFARMRRYASPAQFAALIARDSGCVLCGRDSSRCEAHHIDPFNSPNKGKTDVEAMALVCSSCHHWLHDSKRTLVWQHAPPNRGPSGSDDDSADSDTAISAHKKGAERTWSTRPATPREIAPTKPKSDRARRTLPAKPARSGLRLDLGQ